MGKLMSEEKALSKLGVGSFAELTKDKVIEMTSILDKMEPEVAVKALEQFPEFTKTVKEMLTDYKGLLDKGMEENKESVQSYYDTCNSIIVSLQKELDKEIYTFEERKYIIDKMMEMADKIDKKDTENKRFLAGMALLGGAVVGGLIMALGSTLGGSTKIGKDDII